MINQSCDNIDFSTIPRIIMEPISKINPKIRRVL